ncbi:PadR family transcriptional regulator [Paenibacillus sp. FSL H8-0548]|uniref:PadR family transcriptional regulator n=1 Tax=Paenibacillus sp. FSL H8-0548 TaxID=1920422 RepID=UPI00096EDBBD|nr:PadR family transcriptional regulator [Paenibacillus sp. FSL H8-0548]OMF37388.1 PadR family transcriptional regulator [Paenibacillus sp. FSL H8-0548]
MIELVILGMLIEGKMSGYDIKKVTEQTVGIFYKMSYGSLYPALKRLVQSEYVTEEETNDSKNKKIYSITDEGRSHFIQWLREPLQSNKREYLIKIFFYDYLDAAAKKQNLIAYQQNIAHQISQMEAVQSIVSKELEQLEDKEQYYYRVSVMHYGVHFFKMENEWLKKIIDKEEL